MPPAINCYILEFTFDVIESAVRIILTPNPDQSTRDKEILIPGVINFQVNRYHDPHDISLGDFEILKAFPVEKHWRYVLDTGDAKVTFDSTQKIDL